MLLLASDWSKRVTWRNIPQLKLRNIRLKAARFAENTSTIKLNNLIWRVNMLGYLSLDITDSSKFPAFLDLRFWKTVRFSEQTKSAAYFRAKWRPLFVSILALVLKIEYLLVNNFNIHVLIYMYHFPLIFMMHTEV